VTGLSLRLWVRAHDNNRLSGPGVGDSRDFLFRVVTEEELRADLLRREVDQRKAFELVIKEQEEVRLLGRRLTDSRAGAAPAAGDAPPEAAETPPAAPADTLMQLHRRQKAVGTSLATAADRFEQLLLEAQNNRLDETESEAGMGDAPSMVQRLSERIIGPLRDLDAEEVPRVLQALDAARRSSANPSAFRGALDEAIAAQQRILDRMNEILSAMQDAETFQEIVNRAIEIKRGQERLRQLTRQRQEQSRREEIFDDDQSKEKKK
jgi:hypothetical protein